MCEEDLRNLGIAYKRAGHLVLAKNAFVQGLRLVPRDRMTQSVQHLRYNLYDLTDHKAKNDVGLTVNMDIVLALFGVRDSHKKLLFEGF